MIRRSPLIAVLIAVTFMVTARSYGAERVINGVPFHVDEITTIDDEMVKLRIGDETELVAQATLDDEIVGKVLRSSDLASRFDSASLGNFIVRAFADGFAERASLALSVLGSRESSAEEIVRSIDLMTAKGDPAIVIEKSLLPHTKCNPESCGVLILSIAEIDLPWVRSQGAGLIYRFEKNIAQAGANRSYELLANRKLEAAFKEIALLETLIGSGDSTIGELVEIKRRLELAVIPGAVGDVARFLTILDLTKDNQRAYDAIYPFILNSLHSEAERAISEKEPGEAIRILSHVDFIKRTPTTHNLVRQALSLGDLQNSSYVLERNIAEMLRAFSEKDGNIKEAYYQLLTKRFDSKIEAYAVSDAQAEFKRIVDVEVDPSEKNDERRVQIAEIASRIGMGEVAIENVEQVRTGLGLIQRIRLLWSGYYIERIWFLLMLIVAISGLLVMEKSRQGEHLFVGIEKFVRRIFSHISEYGNSDLEGEADEDPEEQRSRMNRLFVNARSSSHRNPKSAEYEECLKQLGLGSTAPLHDLKNAYRRMVKDSHPDSQGGDGVASEKFIELNRVYERALELRKELGIPDEES